jgi:hypothetical protein
MITKDKALELIQKFYLDDLLDDLSFRQAKQCALIAINEIINCNDNEDFEGHFRDDYGAVHYWKQVKQEIEAL